MPQKDEQAIDRARKERRHKDEERGGGAKPRGGRRAASEGGEGSEEARRLRWRINQLEKEKVTLTASHNQEVRGDHGGGAAPLWMLQRSSVYSLRCAASRRS